MNNNTYYRAQPKKKATAYLMPFIIILILIGIVVFGWKTLNSAFLGGSASSPNEKVFLNIEAGSAKAMTVSSSEWKNAPDNINLYSGERIKTGSDGRVTLTFPDKSLARMDKNSELEFSKIKQKEESTQTEITLESGQIWVKIEPTVNPDSSFAIVTDLLTVDSVGATLNVTAEGAVYVMSGSAQIGIKAEDEIIKTVNLGVGQQLVVTAEVLTELQEGKNPEMLFALDDTFRKSGWYRWNKQKDGMISGFEEPDSELSGGYSGYGDIPEDDSEEGSEIEADMETVNPDRLVAVTKPSNNGETNESSVSVSGTYDTEKVTAVYVNGKKASTSEGKWTVNSVALTEGKNTINIEAETDTGRSKLDPLIITLDTSAPAAPKVTDPVALTGETDITVDDIEQIIKGSVSSDTFAVIVNDYQLGKYVPGSGTFEYYAKTAFGNLKVGENEYIIYAEDKAGNRSDATTLILTLEQETVDEKGGTSATETSSGTTVTTDSLPAAQSTGGVAITAPNDGKSFTTSETSFEIKGTVPAGTVKVVVNDYTLSKFVEGATTFSYKASSTFGNLEIGAKNTYEATAYGADGKVLGKASITIDVESGSASAPTISMPSSTGTYSTSLNEVVIGGTVGKWVTGVKINGTELSEYIPGSEEWRKTVPLSMGENSFKVCAEQNDAETGCATIAITYQP